MKKPITKEKLYWWGHALVHPFDGFYEIRFSDQGSLLLAFLLMIVFGVMRCLSAQYTGFVMNLTNQDELDTLSLFISNISVLLLFSLSNWTVTTLFNGKGKHGGQGRKGDHEHEEHEPIICHVVYGLVIIRNVAGLRGFFLNEGFHVFFTKQFKQVADGGFKGEFPVTLSLKRFVVAQEIRGLPQGDGRIELLILNC